MGQRADEVAGRGHSADGDAEVYVARPGETRVVRADAAHSASIDDRPLGRRHESDDPEEIRAEMEHTRAEMSQTIDAIQDRLNPEDLKEQAKDIAKDVTEQVSEHVRETLRDATHQAKTAVREATVGRAERLLNDASDTAWEVRSGVFETIRENPVPAALMGIGLGWLLMNGSNRPSRPRTYSRYENPSYRYYGGQTYPVYGARSAYPTYGVRASYPYTSTPAPGYAATPGYETGYREESGGLGEKVGETAHRVREGAADAVSGAGERASEFVEQAGDRAGEMVDQAGEMLHHAGHAARGTGSSFMDTVRQNPVPAALAAIGLGWLFMNNSGTSSQRSEYESDYDYDRYGYSRAYDRDRASLYGGRATHYGNGHGNPAEKVAGRVGDAAGQVQERAAELAGEARDLVDEARDRVGEFGHEAQYRMQRAPGQLERMVQDNPLAVGAVAVALGAALGMMVPETRQEHELLGETRDRLVDRAQDMVQETGEKLQRVVGEVSSTAQEKVQEAVQEVGSTAQQQARREGMTS